MGYNLIIELFLVFLQNLNLREEKIQMFYNYFLNFMMVDLIL